MAAANLEEYRNLKDTALAVEKLLADSPHGVNPVFTNVLSNIQKRLEVLELEIKADEIKIRNEQAVAIAAAEKEAALNAGERGIFADLMRRDYFAKANMPQVNSFYKNIWDKLTDDGKGEISHRLWEGIRHGEQKFSELVDDIKEKEAKRIYDFLTKRDNAHNQTSLIPEADQQEFIRAVDSGNKAEAYQILDRQSFTNNVSVASPREIKSELVQANREADSGKIKSANINQSDKVRPDDVEELPSIGDLNLKDLKIADALTQGIAANAIRADTAVKRSL